MEGGRCLGVLLSHKTQASRFFIREASNSKTLFSCMASLQVVSRPSGKDWGEKISDADVDKSVWFILSGS